MAVFIAYLLATLVAVEIVRRSDLLDHARQIGRYSLASGRLLANPKVSDHWKEKALLGYAGRNLVATLRLLGDVLMIALPFGIAALVTDPGLGGLVLLLIDPVWLASTLALSLGYLAVVRRLSRA